MFVQLSGKTFTFPHLCVCCCGQPDTQLPISATRSHGVRVVHTRTNTWRVPYCSSCYRHVAAYKHADTMFGLAVGGSFVLGFLLLFAHPALGIVTWLGAFVGAFFVRSHFRKLARGLLSHSCATTAYAAGYAGWSGTLETFVFWNRTYAAEFMLANSRKLVNLTPDGHQLLDWAMSRQHAAQVHAQFEQNRAVLEQQADQARAAHAEAVHQHAHAREDADYFKWITKLEAAKGPAGRKAAVEAGLAALTRPELREQLIAEASRVEVRAALDKADGQKSDAAKMRTLQAALEIVESHPSSTAVKDENIGVLRSAINELTPKQ